MKHNKDFVVCEVTINHKWSFCPQIFCLPVKHDRAGVSDSEVTIKHSRAGVNGSEVIMKHNISGTEITNTIEVTVKHNRADVSGIEVTVKHNRADVNGSEVTMKHSDDVIFSEFVLIYVTDFSCMLSFAGFHESCLHRTLF